MPPHDARCSATWITQDTGGCYPPSVPSLRWTAAHPQPPPRSFLLEAWAAPRTRREMRGAGVQVSYRVHGRAARSGRLGYRALMTDHEVVQLLREHWETHANSGDFETAHAIYHEDAVLEWPQSGERFVGKATMRAMREHAPSLNFTTWRITGSGNHWAAENFMSVEGGEAQMTVSILTFRGEKVAHEIVYITEPFEAAPERAPLAERFNPRDLRA